MSDGDALLRGILECPEDDTARLVFADWLDENGQAERAEFVRVQVELARALALEPVGNHPMWLAGHRVAYHHERAFLAEMLGGTCRCVLCLQTRQVELFNCLYSDDLPGSFVPNLDGRLGRDSPHAHYRRGFVESVTCTAAAFLAHAGAIFSRHPVTAVRLSDRIPHVYQGVFNWFTEERDGFKMQGAGYIPGVIYEEMIAGGYYLFDHEAATSTLTTEEEAYAELSRACVAYGRSLANLGVKLGVD
jgi:uncharacterized protein (TIGR02996 family)